MNWFSRFRRAVRLPVYTDYLGALVLCHRQAAIIKAQAEQIDMLRPQLEVWERRPPLWESAILALRQRVVGDE